MYSSKLVEWPSAELLKQLFFREVKSVDLFVVSVLLYWCQEHEEKLVELVVTQFNKSNSSPSKRERQPTNKSVEEPSVEQMLEHLDQLRLHCKPPSFLNHKTLQHALHDIQSSCTELDKIRYSDLFSMAEDVEEVTVVDNKLHARKQGANAKTGNKSKLLVIYSDTSDED